MSTAVLPPTTLVLPPVPPVETIPIDTMTLAVRNYLAAMRAPVKSQADLEAQVNTFGDMTAICYSACMKYRSRKGNQLYFWDPWPEYSVQFQPEVETEDEEPRHSSRKPRRENTNHHRLRDWIQLWLLQKLAGYRDSSAAEIQVAATTGKFKSLPWRCVYAFRKKVGRSYPKDGVFPRVCVSLDQPVTPDAEIGEDTSLAANIISPKANFDYNFDPSDLGWLVEEYHDDFDRLGISDVLSEIIRGLELGKGDTAENIAARLNIGLRQARNKITACYQILAGNLDVPGIQALYHALDRETPVSGLPEQSQDSKFRYRVISEAARDKWDGVPAKDIAELTEAERPDPGDFIVDGRTVVRIRLQLLRRASMVDPQENDIETYFQDGVQVDRQGDEIGLGIEEIDENDQDE